jgi:phosphatidylethanolamine/phosphatidyl-N-methylethanolamine N-methyltransferase
MDDKMKDEDIAWIEYRERFSELYDKANYSSPLQSYVMRQSHKLAEKEFDEKDNFDRVLEIGAGTGEHLAFVRHNFREYTLTDLDAKTLEIAKNKLADRHRGRVRFDTQIEKHLAYADDSFDRVIATHVLEHIYKPHIALKEWRRVIRNGGVLTVLIPTDPGLAWRLGRHLGPRKNAMSQGIAYDYVMAREHVNSCTNLISILRHYFPDSRESWWPLPIKSVDLNLFFAFNATMKKEG